jgi:trans-aconitate methyltransferase
MYPGKKMSSVVDKFDYNQIWEKVYGDSKDEGPVHRHMHRILRRILKDLDYEKVLDVGCGEGHNLPLLAQGRSLSAYTGIDISTHALEKAKGAVPFGSFHHLDIQQAHLDGSWDLVYCSLILEHLPDDVAALDNMRAMTGKYLVATTIAGDFDRYRAWDEVMGHVRNYRPGELEEKMVKAGFRVRQAIYWGFPFYNLLARALQNHAKVGTGEFNTATRLVARVLYWIYFLNSHRRGDLLTILAEVEP